MSQLSRKYSIATVSLCLGFSLYQIAIAQTEEWIPLFNGGDLTGWKANADPGAFTVKDGILTAHATHPTGAIFSPSTKRVNRFASQILS